jgi:hypothetical protein
VVLVAVVAALSAFVTSRFVECSMCAQPQRTTCDVLDERLGLSPAQKLAVQEIEARFEIREQPLRRALDEANRQLAKAMAEENTYSPRVSAAVEHVHMCMGELQKASIAHLYEISALLNNTQREHLMQFAAQALGACH